MSTKIITVTASDGSPVTVRVTRTDAPVRVSEGFMRMRAMKFRKYLTAELSIVPGFVGEWVEVGGRFGSLRSLVKAVRGHK